MTDKLQNIKDKLEFIRRKVNRLFDIRQDDISLNGITRSGLNESIEQALVELNSYIEARDSEELLATIAELRASLAAITHTGDKVSMVKTAKQALEKAKDIK